MTDPESQGATPAGSLPDGRGPGGPGDFLPTRLTIDPTAYVSPAAILLGHVTLGAHSSVWPTAVLRGDWAPVEVGARTNLQDGAILHTAEDTPCRLGNGVTVGHRAVVHAAVVEDGCLIGIGAIVLTGARIGAGSLVGAGALVAEGAQIPPGSLVLGMPARVIRPVDAALRRLIEGAAENYVEYCRRYREGRMG